VIGVTKPGRKFIDKQVWWWNDEVQAVVQEKKKAFKKWVESKKNDDCNTRKSAHPRPSAFPAVGS